MSVCMQLTSAGVVATMTSLLMMLLSSVSAVTIFDNNTIITSLDKSEDIVCQDGLMLSVWQPRDNITLGDRIKRGTVYFLTLAYLFIGVSIVSDRFMAAIEVITSKEKEVKVRKKDGETQIVVVRVWNETVANLTLMALGSSAPEILLSIIEIVGKNFQAGDLGPGTIVGWYTLLCNYIWHWIFFFNENRVKYNRDFAYVTSSSSGAVA